MITIYIIKMQNIMLSRTSGEEEHGLRERELGRYLFQQRVL